MIIGFTGTRKGMTAIQRGAVRDLLIDYDPHEVHHGDCTGADNQFHSISMQEVNGIIVIHPPVETSLRAYCQGDIVLHEKTYEQRNRDIVQASDLVIAAPDTFTEQPRGGTWQTVRFAREYNKPCKIVLPSGVVIDA